MTRANPAESRSFSRRTGWLRQRSGYARKHRPRFHSGLPMGTVTPSRPGPAIGLRYLVHHVDPHIIPHYRHTTGAVFAEPVVLQLVPPSRALSGGHGLVLEEIHPAAARIVQGLTASRVGAFAHHEETLHSTVDSVRAWSRTGRTGTGVEEAMPAVRRGTPRYQPHQPVNFSGRLDTVHRRISLRAAPTCQN